MNYFKCSVGGSGNKWKLTVTCNSVFAGLTVTCTDGVTTLTKTCPATSPYVVKFDIPNAGTWTVSAIYGGQTNSVTVQIVNSATLNYIPNGSTVTPVNDIQTWLHCANIWDKSYTTINQVLADTSTLLALISTNNAADYMARSTNWASSVCANQTAMGYIGNNNYCANKLLANSTWLNAICNSTYFESVLNIKVPTMTSNTTPSGEVFANSYEAGWDPYKAFNNDQYAWVPQANGNTNYVGYKFTSKVSVKKATIKAVYSSQSAISGLKIQGTNNFSSWTNPDLATFDTAAGGSTKTVIISSQAAYNYFRIYGAFPNSSSQGFKIQFYGRASS